MRVSRRVARKRPPGMPPFQNLHSIIELLEKPLKMLKHGRIRLDRTVPLNIDKVKPRPTRQPAINISPAEERFDNVFTFGVPLNQLDARRLIDYEGIVEAGKYTSERFAPR